MRISLVLRACLPGLILASGLICLAETREAGEKLPRPGIGLFFKPDEAAAMRLRIQRAPCQAIYQQMLKQAGAALAKWAQDKKEIEPIAPKLPDLTMEFVPNEFAPEGGKAAGKLLEEYASQGAPAAAFVYLMTGDRAYAEFAWEVFKQCARVNSWG